MTPDQILASWKEKETSVRERLRAPGVALRSQIFGMSGMEVFEAIFAGVLHQRPLATL